jgi:hypothetical protein
VDFILGTIDRAPLFSIEQNGLAKKSLLPYKIGLVRTQEQFSAVCTVRALAYEKHLPGFGELLTKPDALDFAPGVLVMYVQDKASGKIVGTARIQTNWHEPLAIAEDAPLPAWLTQNSIAEISRFAVLPGYNKEMISLSRLILKSCMRYCLASQISFMVLGARKGLVRGYLRLGCKDVDPNAQPLKLHHGNNLEHRILYFDVNRTEREWFASGHPDYDFLYKTFHPDIELFSSLTGSWHRPRLNSIRHTENYLPPIV